MIDTELLRTEVEQLLADFPPDGIDDRALRQARFDRGLAFVHFDAEHGGRSGTIEENAFVDQFFLSAGCIDWRTRNVIGLGMGAPVLFKHGSPQQKDLIRPLFVGDDIWCQLFSEPGAGSDLAALATSAKRDGDSWIINGQKVWTTLGHVARWGLLIARTDPDAPKHKGLTYFVLDMQAPGVDVRPLRQITGDAEFNEVFMTDVRIPDSARLGEVGDGWKVVMTTLMNERVALGAALSQPGEGPIGQAVELFKSTEQGDPIVRDRLLSLWVAAEVARLNNARASTARQGAEPGPEGSVAKLQMAELNKSIYSLCVDLQGEAGMTISGYEFSRPNTVEVYGTAEPVRAYLRARANSIEGGTSEVLRNVLGERVLGLPAEPRLDKDIPWREVRRS